MKKLALIAVVCLLAVPALAPAAIPQQSAAVLTSSTSPGAKNVSLTVTLTYLMQCGNPGKTPLHLKLPAQMTAPTKILPSQVLLNGKAAKSVTVHGSTMVITIFQPQFLTCDVMGIGTLKVVIAKSAGLGNPKAAGVYGFAIAIGPLKATPKLQIA